MFRLIALATSVIALVSPALADITMPQNLRPLPPKEVKSLYVEKSLVFPHFRYFYKRNGEITGVSDEPKSFARGRWTNEKNRFCVDVIWQIKKGEPTFPFKACYDWFTDGSTYWTQIFSSSDASLVGKVFQGNPSVVRDGDVVKRLMGKAMQDLGY